MSARYREQAGLAAAKLFVNLPFFQAEYIACYLPTEHEFDTQPIVNILSQSTRRCYLPMITEQKSVQFSRYVAGDSLVANQFGILEPSEQIEVIAPEKLDVVLMPLVAFDNYGHRLGMGGGYYDRTFNFLQHQPKRRVKMIGIAYALQQADSIVSDPWDIKLDGVITEKGYIKF